jgi:hypothetical protein
MTEKILDRSDIGAALEKMRRERMTKRMTRNPLPDPNLSDRSPHGTLHLGLMQMMAPPNPRRIDKRPRSGEQIVPRPFPVGVRHLNR